MALFIDVDRLVDNSLRAWAWVPVLFQVRSKKSPVAVAVVAVKSSFSRSFSLEATSAAPVGELRM